MKKSHFRILKKPWTIAAIVIILIIGGIIFAKSRPAAPNFEYSTAAISDVIERVSVTGTISPAGKAGLAFEKSGAVSQVNVGVGDAVKAGQVLASLDNANDAAALASARATLADMSRSLTPQELAVEQASLASAQASAVNAARDAYVKAQGAVVNYADMLFTNPQSVNPTFKVTAPSTAIANSLGVQRSAVTDTFNQWSAELATATSDTADAVISDAAGHLASIKAFLNGLSSIVNALSPGNSGLAQAQIDAYVSAMNTALTSVNEGIDGAVSAQTGLASAESAYSLKLAGDSSESIAAQAAKVAQAQAQIDQDILLSPLAGIVTQADPNVGEFVAAGQTAFSVQSSGFKIEAYVPEADIAKVAVGDLASTTLDAYGSNVDFPAIVSAIDPAETVIEGVPTYKVTLLFAAPDARIRSGMTANLEILTHEAGSVIEVPYRAVTATATSTTVRVVSANGRSYTPVAVVTGLKGSDGTIEIVSGIQPGDKVVTYIKP